jgi:hypothetical protein
MLGDVRGRVALMSFVVGCTSCAVVIGMPDRGAAPADATDSGAALDALSETSATDVGDEASDTAAVTDSIAVDAVTSEAETPIATFCDLHASAAFCDDFETTLGSPRWDTISAASAFSLDGADGVAPPTTGHAAVLATSDLAYLEKQLSYGVGKAPKSVTVSFDFRPITSPDDATYVAKLEWWSGSSRSWLALHMYAGGIKVQKFFDTATAFPDVFLPDAPLNKWSHLELSITFQPSLSCTATVNGETRPVEVPSGFTSALDFTFDLGVSLVGTASPRKYKYDNVLIETE